MARRISVGWGSRPDNLEEGVIYVNIKSASEGRGVNASAFSDQPFRYKSVTLAGDSIEISGKEAGTSMGDATRVWEKPYKEFLEELVTLNDGQVNYDRLVNDVVFNDALMQGMIGVFRKFNSCKI